MGIRGKQPMTDGCQGCKRRTIEPNCHNVETCAYWARHMDEQERKYAERELEQKLRRPDTSYVKNANRNGGLYIRGERRPAVPKGRTLVKGDGP